MESSSSNPPNSPKQEDNNQPTFEQLLDNLEVKNDDPPNTTPDSAVDWLSSP